MIFFAFGTGIEDFCILSGDGYTVLQQSKRLSKGRIGNALLFKNIPVDETKT
jgi:hypothetical protein